MNPFLQKQPLTQSVVQTLEPGLSPQRAGHLLPQYMYCSLGSLHSDDPAENIKKKTFEISIKNYKNLLRI